MGNLLLLQQTLSFETVPAPAYFHLEMDIKRKGWKENKLNSTL